MFFSIVITTYNAEKFLIEALNSLKNQTFQDFEWIITDDGSTDNTLKVCKTWFAENPQFQSRLKIIESPINTGVSANTNRGLKAASGEWIQVLSADDTFLENSLKIARDFIVSNPDCSIFQGIAAAYNTYFSKQNFINFRTENYNIRKKNIFNKSAAQQYQMLLRDCCIVAPAVFYKKSIVEQVGFCDESIPMIDDWPLWLKLTKAGYKFYFLNEVVVNYRVHQESISYKLFGSKANFLAKNPKHIAVFVPNFEINGPMTVCANYTNVLIKNGYLVDVIVANEKGSGKSMFPKQATIVNLGNVRVRHSIGKLRQYLKKTSASTLICFGDLSSFAGIFATFWLRKRINVIVSQHGFISDLDEQDLGFLGKITPFFKRKLYPLANRIIAVSNGAFEDLKTHKISTEKISVIPNFVDKNHLLKLAEQPISQELPKDYIVFVGRLARVKNIQLLIDAFELIDDENLHLVVVGARHASPLHSPFAVRRSPNSCIHFLGEIPNVLPIIKQAKIVAIPSFSETLSMVAIEAATLGKTVVHTPNQGCLEIFGSNGSYYSKTFDDPKDFAEQLEKALKNPIDSSVLNKKLHRFEEATGWLLLQNIL